MKNAEKYAEVLATILEFSDCTFTKINCAICPFSDRHEVCCLPNTYAEWLSWLNQEAS
jgi:hypothetical protein